MTYEVASLLFFRDPPRWGLRKMLLQYVDNLRSVSNFEKQVLEKSLKQNLPYSLSLSDLVASPTLSVLATFVQYPFSSLPDAAIQIDVTNQSIACRSPNTCYPPVTPKHFNNQGLNHVSQPLRSAPRQRRNPQSRAHAGPHRSHRQSKSIVAGRVQ